VGSQEIVPAVTTRVGHLHSERQTDAITCGTAIGNPDGSWTIKTHDEDDVIASTDDWIVRDADGEIYPVKADDFAQTFEPVPDVA
jgi:hypothetical protein